ncbi:hypothetical protein GC163_08805 [bacterium]|nr:hypothetical protein [bacterium]
MMTQSWFLARRLQTPAASRRGVFLVVAAVCLAAIMTLVAFSVDSGMISLTKTKMQNATDAAALAAAMEITYAISNAGDNVNDVFTYAQNQARDKAAEVAELNDIYINSGEDVVFGRRSQDNQGNYSFDWNPAGYQVNCVKVVARRDNEDESAPDGKIPGLFTGMFRENGTAVTAESIAYIEPRDIVVVHDFSRSMNFDSYFSDEVSTPLPQATLEQNLQTAYNDLAPTYLGTMTYLPSYITTSRSSSDGAKATVTHKGTSISVTTNTKIKKVQLTYTNGSQQTFTISNNTTTSGNWAGTGSYSGKRIRQANITVYKYGSSSQQVALPSHQYDWQSMVECFSLGNYPYDGGGWSEFFDYVTETSVLNNYGVMDKFGGQTFMCYLMRMRPSYADTEDLWKTRHYPFHAIKEGHQMLCDFLGELGFDDYLGMVSYDTDHRIETTLSSGTNSAFPNVNISSSPLTNDYDAVNKLMKYKQAAHYSYATNMSGGLKDAISLIDNHKRSGSRPAIILMTDGNSNTLDRGESGSLPSGWSWNTLFDYDGNGSADYTTSNTQSKAVLKYVKDAVDKGYTVHAISVGNDADRNLLQAVAWLGNGYWVDVPGGMSASNVEDKLEDAFIKIASAVPPARLVKTDE